MSLAASLSLVVAAAVVAFALRGVLIFGLVGVELPGWVERSLAYIGPAVLASMTVSFAFGGPDAPNLSTPTVITMLVALVVAVWKRNLIVTLAVAMPVLWLTTAALS